MSIGGISKFYDCRVPISSWKIKTLNRLNHLWVGSLWHVFSLYPKTYGISSSWWRLEILPTPAKNTSQTPLFRRVTRDSYRDVYIKLNPTNNRFGDPKRFAVGPLTPCPKAPITVEFNGYTCVVAEVMFPVFSSPKTGWYTPVI